MKTMPNNTTLTPMAKNITLSFLRFLKALSVVLIAKQKPTQAEKKIISIPKHTPHQLGLTYHKITVNNPTKHVIIAATRLPTHIILSQ